MSDDPQQAPKKFADEQPYSDEDGDGVARPGGGDDSDAERDDTDGDADS